MFVFIFVIAVLAQLFVPTSVSAVPQSQATAQKTSQTVQLTEAPDAAPPVVGPVAPSLPPAGNSAAATPVPPLAPAMFNFAMPPFDSSATATDLSALNDAPAGRDGFVRCVGEHFVDGKGRILRLWGVNINFAGAFPTKDEATGIAARLAKFGFNAVRLHHYEGYPAPAGIWAPFGTGSSHIKFPREFDPVQLDRLDFFISELIKRGIYIDVNLHVARKTTEAEGVSSAADLPEKDKGVNYYDQRLIDLSKEFCRSMLTHVNPYTGRALKDEPGVCAMEVDNENSLLSMWLDGSFKVPLSYEQDLRNRWNAWLGKRYTEKSLRAAWTEVDDPVDPQNIIELPLPEPPVDNPGGDPHVPNALNSLDRLNLALVGGAAGTTMVDATGGPSVDGFVQPGIRVSLDQVGNVPWSFQLNRDGLDLLENAPYTLSFWARADTPRRISVNLWQDRQPNRFCGFTGYADLTTDWQQFSFVFRPVSPDPGHSRLSWNLGNAAGVVQLGEIELHTGGRISVPDQWTLANGVPLIDFKSTPVWNARRDYAEFLGGIESAHVADMRAFLRTELGVKVPIWHTQAQFGGWGGLARESDSDAMDVHAYWKHPDFGPLGWNGTSWTIDNTSMASAVGTDPLSSFAYYHVHGKPLLMTEWNSGQPNDFGAESLLMASAYAAWQDWAGVFIFDYHSNGEYTRDKIDGFFSIDSQPVKMASAPTAALVFRRRSQDAAEPNDLGDATPASVSETITLPRDSIWREVSGWPDGPSAAPIIRTLRDAGGDRTLSLREKVYANIGEGTLPVATSAELTTAKVFDSDTAQLRWDGNRGVFSLNTPRSKELIGAVGGHGPSLLDELRIDMPPSSSNWAAFALTSLDGAPVAGSKSLLFSTLGKAENPGMGWNADHNSIGNNWGTGPSQIEGIAASVTLVTSLKSARVWALDGTGADTVEVPSMLKNGLLTFDVSPSFKTLWYRIVAG